MRANSPKQLCPALRYAIEEVRKYEKTVYIKNVLKMAGERMHTPLDPPLAMSYRNHQIKSLAYFSHVAPFSFVLFY